MTRFPTHKLILDIGIPCLSYGFYSITSISFLSEIVTSSDHSILSTCLTAYLQAILFCILQFSKPAICFTKNGVIKKITSMFFISCYLYFPICYGVMYSSIISLFHSTNTSILYLQLYYISIGCVYFSFILFFLRRKSNLQEQWNLFQDSL